MLKGIVTFEVEITKLEGKFKLSQNKTVNEQKNIADSIHSEKELSGFMKKQIPNNKKPDSKK